MFEKKRIKTHTHTLYQRELKMELEQVDWKVDAVGERESFLKHKFCKYINKVILSKKEFEWEKRNLMQPPTILTTHLFPCLVDVTKRERKNCKKIGGEENSTEKKVNKLRNLNIL
jgi:hypothetical protein